MKIKSHFLNLRYGIANCIKWFPLIWRDRDWDQNYLYKILGFKLSKMSDFHKSHGSSADSEPVSLQLWQASNLCDKIINYDYSEEALQEFKKKYPDFELDMTLTLTEDGSYLAHYNLDDLPQELQELYHQHFQIEEELKNRDRKQLFHLIEEKIENWWD